MGYFVDTLKELASPFTKHPRYSIPFVVTMGILALWYSNYLSDHTNDFSGTITSLREPDKWSQFIGINDSIEELQVPYHSRDRTAVIGSEVTGVVRKYPFSKKRFVIELDDGIQE